MTVCRMLSWDISGFADRQGERKALCVTQTPQGLTVVALIKQMPL